MDIIDDNENNRILIIEDGKLNQQILEDTLKTDYILHTISSGDQAMKAARRFHPHLILLDIILPDINGFEVLTRLKSSPVTQNIPVIIITGLDNDNDEEKGLSMGAVDYIRKPFKNFLVKARVNVHIQIVNHLRTIEKLSYFDSLTDLPNRRRFDYHIAYEWSRATRNQTMIGFLMMDLDNFKKYNDNYGHAQGDLMLKAAANILKNTLNRATDMPCRWGGEEFAVFIPEASPEVLLNLAEKMRAGIEGLQIPHISTNEVTTMTVSIGMVCTIPSADEQLTNFIQKADSLLYKAKNAGRNQIQTELL